MSTIVKPGPESAATAVVAPVPATAPATATAAAPQAPVSAPSHFIRRFDLPYPSVFDPTNAIGLTYDLYAPPATLFYDADGNLVRTVPGQISAEDLAQGLRQITAPGA